MTKEEQAQYISKKLMENPEFRKTFVGAITDAINVVVKAINALEQEPCDDAISRAEVLSHAKKDMGNGHEQPFDYVEVDVIKQLPPVTPQYTDAEIQKMQDLEFAEIQKAYEIGKDDGSEVLDKIRAEIEQMVSRYTISRERGGMGQVEWEDRLIKEADILQILDKYKASPTGAERSTE